MEESRQFSKKTPLPYGHDPAKSRDISGVTMEYRPPSALSDNHRVYANRGDGGNLGALMWHRKTGEIHWVGVNHDVQGLKIATEMMNHARKLSDMSGIVAPQHSSNRSTAGNEWAKSVGGNLPEWKEKF